MKLLIIFLLICCSLSLNQLERPELSLNITVPIFPTSESNWNISSSQGEDRPIEHPRRDGIRVRPFLEPDREPSRPTRFNDTRSMNVTSPIWSNRSILVGEPPFIPASFWTEKHRIIPPQFWDQNNTDAILLLNNNGEAVSCDKDGDVKLIRVSKNKPIHLWFPEFLIENIVRLRSYFGGYLVWDSNKGAFSCDSRLKNSISRWEVFLQITESRRNQCLFLIHKNKLLGFHEKKLVLENWSGDSNRFCFYGMPSSLIRWSDRASYKYNFDPSRIFIQDKN